MKSLYSILGVSPDASPAQIETAYADLLTRLKDAPGDDSAIRLVAIKEAYSVLSDPVARQRYNQKLFNAESPSLQGVSSRAAYPEESGSFGIRKILVVGAIVLAGILLYTYNAREREKLRIEHEKEVQKKVLELAEEKQKLAAAEQEARLARQQRFEDEAREQRERAEQERYVRELDARQRGNLREEEQRKQREAYDKQRQEREAENQRRREMQDAERRVQRDKQELQRLERERYGRVITR